MPVYADPFGSFVDGFRQGEQDKRAADKAGGSGSSGRGGGGGSGGGGKTTGDTPVPKEDDSTAGKTTEATVGRPGLPAMTGDMNQYPDEAFRRSGGVNPFDVRQNQYPDEASRRSGGVDPFDVRQNPLLPGAASPEVQAMPPAIVPGMPIMDLQAYLNANMPPPVVYPQGFPEMPPVPKMLMPYPGQNIFPDGPFGIPEEQFTREYNRMSQQQLDQIDQGSLFGGVVSARMRERNPQPRPTDPSKFAEYNRGNVKMPLGPQDFETYERLDRPRGRYDRNPFLPFGEVMLP